MTLPDPGHGTDAFKQLTEQITSDPADPANALRVRVVREVLGMADDFADWWLTQLRSALGTTTEENWLRIGAICEVLAGKQIEITGLVADHGQKAQLILDTGLVPAPDSALRGQLMAAVLDGQCSETTSARWEAGWLAVSLSPADLIPELWVDTEREESEQSRKTRVRATQLLRQASHAYPTPAKIRRPTQRSQGTTLPYAEASAALTAAVGRCWLAIELAVIGASSPLRNGFQRRRDDQPFGPTGAAGALIDETRRSRADPQWWRNERDKSHDDLSDAEWAFALWVIADGAVLDELFVELEVILAKLSEDRCRALLLASARLARAGYLADRCVSIAAATERGAELLRSRHPDLAGADRAPVETLGAAGSAASLAEAARDHGWLKVDKVAAYR